MVLLWVSLLGVFLVFHKERHQAPPTFLDPVGQVNQWREGFASEYRKGRPREGRDREAGVGLWRQ